MGENERNVNDGWSQAMPLNLRTAPGNPEQCEIPEKKGYKGLKIAS